MSIIINSLPSQSKISKPIKKEVNFAVSSAAYRNLYTQAYPKGLSPVIEKVSISFLQLSSIEKDALISYFLQQDTGNFLGYIMPNEATERPFYPPRSWKIDETTQLIGTTYSIIYNVHFDMVGYYNV